MTLKPATRDPDVHKVERLSIPYSTNTPEFGSCLDAETLSALEIPYIAINPGASCRGLHVSIINFLPWPHVSRCRAPIWMANTAPCGPTYASLDAEVQKGTTNRAVAANRRH